MESGSGRLVEDAAIRPQLTISAWGSGSRDLPDAVFPGPLLWLSSQEKARDQYDMFLAYSIGGHL